MSKSDTLVIESVQTIEIDALAEALASEKPHVAALFLDTLLLQLEKVAKRSEKLAGAYGAAKPFAYAGRLAEIARAIAPDSRQELLAALTAAEAEYAAEQRCAKCQDADAASGSDLCASCTRAEERRHRDALLDSARGDILADYAKDAALEAARG